MSERHQPARPPALLADIGAAMTQKVCFRSSNNVMAFNALNYYSTNGSQTKSLTAVIDIPAYDPLAPKGVMGLIQTSVQLVTTYN